MKDLLEQVKDEKGKFQDKYEGYHRVYLYMKVFYGLFIAWMGYNVLMEENLNAKNRKYLKESLIAIKTCIDHYYPNLLTNKNLLKFFDYNILLEKIYEMVCTFCFLFIIGGVLTAVGYKIGKIIIIVNLLLNILLINNILYLQQEKYKVIVFKYLALFGAAFYL